MLAKADHGELRDRINPITRKLIERDDALICQRCEALPACPASDAPRASGDAPLDSERGSRWPRWLPIAAVALALLRSRGEAQSEPACEERWEPHAASSASSSYGSSCGDSHRLVAALDDRRLAPHDPPAGSGRLTDGQEGRVAPLPMAP